MNAITLIDHNLTPVLLGASGDWLKRPIEDNWQTKTVDRQLVAIWQRRNRRNKKHNIGVRTGQQPDGRFLLVYDFDIDAKTIFPAWRKQAEAIIGCPLVVVETGKGYHAYFLNKKPVGTQKLAYSPKLNEQGRLQARIETKGEGGQVVSAGSLHPNGHYYKFADESGGYDSIPEITTEQNEQLELLCKSFCEKPKPVVRQVTRKDARPVSGGVAKDCLDYAKKYIGGDEKSDGKGNIKFDGNGGLFVTTDGRKWYCHSEAIGGGLAALVAWNEGISKEEAIAKVYPPTPNFTLSKSKNGYDIELKEGQFLGDVDLKLPKRAMLGANTGIGKTTHAVNIPGRVILVVPTQAIVEQQCRINPHAVPFYQFNRKISGDEKLIITTTNSVQKLLPKIDASLYALVADEAHEFAVAGYRQRAYDGLAMCLGGAWQNVILMTGTPFPLVWGGMELYEPVTVTSPTRTQKARLVRWQNEKGKGSKPQTAVSLMPGAHKKQRILIYLQNKKNQLDALIYELKQKGYTRPQISVINADTRTEIGQDNDHYLHLMENERLPDGVQVVIATAVLTTGINIKQKFDQVHFLTAVSSIEAQQIANRFRGAAPGMVYDYSNKEATGKAVHFDLLMVANEIHKKAKQTAVSLTAHIQNMTPEGMALAEYARKTAQGLLDARIIEFVAADADTQEADYYQPSPAGVTHETYKRFRAAERKNPPLYKANLATYGWQFEDDIVYISLDNANSGRAAFVAECHEERQKRVGALAAALFKDGYTATQEGVRDSGKKTSLYLRNAMLALDLHGDKTSGKPGLVKTWKLATDAIIATEDSGQKRKALLRRLNIQKGRKLNKIIGQIYAAFAIGDRLESDQMATKMTALCANNPAMRIILKGETISKERAVRFLRDYFHMKRCKIVVEGGRINGYELMDDCPHIQCGEKSSRVDKWAAGADEAVSLPIHKTIEKEVRQAASHAIKQTKDCFLDVLSGLTPTTRQIRRDFALGLR